MQGGRWGSIAWLPADAQGANALRKSCGSGYLQITSCSLQARPVWLGVLAHGSCSHGLLCSSHPHLRNLSLASLAVGFPDEVCCLSLPCAELHGPCWPPPPAMQPPACDDGRLNGSESDVDCGASCPDQCRDGKQCRTDRDCQSGVCSDAGICVVRAAAALYAVLATAAQCTACALRFPALAAAGSLFTLYCESCARAEGQIVFVYAGVLCHAASAWCLLSARRGHSGS